MADLWSLDRIDEGLEEMGHRLERQRLARMEDLAALRALELRALRCLLGDMTTDDVAESPEVAAPIERDALPEALDARTLVEDDSTL